MFSKFVFTISESVASVQMIFLAIRITGESEDGKIFSSVVVEVQGRP